VGKSIWRGWHHFSCFCTILFAFSKTLKHSFLRDTTSGLLICFILFGTRFYL
jgi:hypothetical protein